MRGAQHILSFIISNKSYFKYCVILTQMVRHKHDRNKRKGGNLLYSTLSMGIPGFKKGKYPDIASFSRGKIYSIHVAIFRGGGDGQGEMALYNTSRLIIFNCSSTATIYESRCFSCFPIDTIGLKSLIKMNAHYHLKNEFEYKRKYFFLNQQRK